MRLKFRGNILAWYEEQLAPRYSLLYPSQIQKFKPNYTTNHCFAAAAPLFRSNLVDRMPSDQSASSSSSKDSKDRSCVQVRPKKKCLSLECPLLLDGSSLG